MSATTEITEINEIGKKICKAYNGVRETVTAEEVKRFASYISTQEATLPLFHPSTYMRGGDKLLAMAKRRTEALQVFFGEE